MIGVGIIGAGFMGRNHFNQYEKLTDRAKVVALCDKEPDRRAGDWSKVGGNVGDAKGTKRDLGDIQPYTDWRAMLADPRVQMVDVCAPTPMHREMVVEALKAGKHVLCEKPMALTVEDCDAMLAAAGQYRQRFMIAQVIRFWPECIWLKRAYDERRFGEMRALHLRRQAATPDYTLGNWALDPKLGGGAILDLHIHDVDFALWLLGKPKSIWAQGTQGATGIDRVHAAWTYAKARVVQLEGFWDMPAKFPFNMGFTAVFQKAAVVWDLGKPLTVYRPGADPEQPEVPGEDGYFGEIEYFVRCVERGEDPAISTPQQSRDAVAMVLAEKQSVLRGQPVDVE